MKIMVNKGSGLVIDVGHLIYRRFLCRCRSSVFVVLPNFALSFASENASDGRYPPVSQNLCSPGSVMSKLRKKSSPISKSTPPDRSLARNAKKLSALSRDRMSSGVLQKLNHNHWDVRIAVSNVPDRGKCQLRDENVLESSKKDKSRFFKSETKRALFEKNSDDKMNKFGGSKAGSRVVPCSEENQDSSPVCNVAKDLPRNDKESEELSLIRAQLLQIEKQQSSLFDLLQVCSICLKALSHGRSF